MSDFKGSRNADTPGFWDESSRPRAKQAAEKPKINPSKFKGDLEAMSITPGIIENAEREQVITPTERETLELINSGLSVSKILNQTIVKHPGLDNSGLYKIFKDARTKIQEHYPEQVRPLPAEASKNKTTPEAVTSASEAILEQYFGPKIKLFTPKTEMKMPFIKTSIDNNQITAAEIKKAYQQNKNFPHHFAALVLALEGLEGAEIARRLCLPPKKEASALCSAAITKILKLRKKS